MSSENESWDIGIHREYIDSIDCCTPQKMARLLMMPPGRFRSPLSIAEKFSLKIFSLIGFFDIFSLQKFFSRVISASVPYSWQILSRYLYREKILKSPLPVPCFFLHDQVKLVSFQMLSRKKSLHGRGNAGDIETALTKATGEVLERFFLSEKKTEIVSSVESLQLSGRRCITPQSLAQFSPEQKKLHPELFYEDQGSFEWLGGRSVFSPGVIFLPLQSIFIGRPRTGELVIREGNSNGGAGGFTLREALLSGIYEVVERDGFMVYWLNQLAPPVIDVSTCQSQEFLALMCDVERYRFEAVFLNTTTDIGIPSVTCVLIDRSSVGPGISIGGACGLFPEELLVKSLREAIMVYGGGPPAAPIQELPEEYFPSSDIILSLKERIYLWKNPKMFPRIQFFLSGKKQTLNEAFPNQRVFENIDDEYEYILDVFRRRDTGYEIYYYQARSHVLDTIGYHVVKVVIPELVSFYLNEVYAPLAARRLETVPKKMGFTTSTRNPWPHPFA